MLNATQGHRPISGRAGTGTRYVWLQIGTLSSTCPGAPLGLTLDRYPLLSTGTEETLWVHKAHLTHCSYTPPGSR